MVDRSGRYSQAELDYGLFQGTPKEDDHFTLVIVQRSYSQTTKTNKGRDPKYVFRLQMETEPDRGLSAEVQKAIDRVEGEFSKSKRM